VQGTVAIEKDVQRAFRAYGDMVYRLALVRLRNVPDAEDIVSDVFLRYLRSAPPTMDAEHEKAWLIRVTVNCSKSLATSTWKSRVEPLLDEIADPSDNVVDIDSSQSAVLAAVTALPDNYRTVVHLFYYEGYKTAEIAQMMDVQDATVRSWLHRARGLLRQSIDLADEE
jgi:RNA polymerase sigma-70 factor (ECF subfamily)